MASKFKVGDEVVGDGCDKDLSEDQRATIASLHESLRGPSCYVVRSDGRRVAMVLENLRHADASRRSPPAQPVEGAKEWVPAVGEMCEGIPPKAGARELWRSGAFIKFSPGKSWGMDIDDCEVAELKISIGIQLVRRDSLRPLTALSASDGGAAETKAAPTEKPANNSSRAEWEAFAERHPGYDLAELARGTDRSVPLRPRCPACDKPAMDVLAARCTACGLTAVQIERRTGADPYTNRPDIDGNPGTEQMVYAAQLSADEKRRRKVAVAKNELGLAGHPQSWPEQFSGSSWED